MKTKSKTTKTLQILIGIGVVLYIFGFTMALFFGPGLDFSNLNTYLSLGLLIVLIVGFALSWTNKKMATGIVLMIWNAGVWITTLYLIEREDDYAMGSAMASLIMILGAFFLLEWYKTSKATLPLEQQQWKFILRVLLVNYAVLYIIVVFSEITIGEPVNYISYPFIIYPILLLIFFVGFLFSWKKELLSGYIFLSWCAILIGANITYSEISTLGGWALFGLPLLLQGIFYIKNHYEFRPK
jgi:hypothetical protein